MVRQGEGHSVGVLRIVSAAGECQGAAATGEEGQGGARHGKGASAHGGGSANRQGQAGRG